ncbi:MAG TPA: maleylacetate reductase [Polyangia bacterium]|nr:maleylacetate reductase [Polyangia bacterium]
MRAFVHIGLPSRVVFGAGSFERVAAEVDHLGLRRVLVLSTPGQRRLADQVALRLESRVAGFFDQAVMHVPIETVVAARAAARAIDADGCVAIGGGSTIGFGKVLALDAETLGAAAGGARLPAMPSLPTLAIPTTFSGSEMTPVFGVTAGGHKETARDPRVLPRTVIYDPDLLGTLPGTVAGPSGVNAIAHCVEALYAEDGNPIISLMAEEGIRTLAGSLPRVVSDASNREARAEALYGAWLAGSCLAAVSTALHHKLCHLLGGRYSLPHAETHTVILPHAVQYNRGAAPEAMARMTRALDGADPAQGLYDLARLMRAPLSLKEIGLPAAALDEVAELAAAATYYNPRPLERPAIRQLLQNAWDGKRPAGE